MIWEAVIFGTVLLVALGCVIVSFVFLYQRKKFRHQQEVTQIQEAFSREMLHSKTEIQEQTLQHIAHEIHDNFSPTLSVINLNLASVVPMVEQPVKEAIVDTKVLIKQLMSEMRALSVSLNTDQIAKLGFPKALGQYIERLRKTGFFLISFNEQGEAYRLPTSKETILLRMCQEILNNIVKHAAAKHIVIQLTYTSSSYKVQIVDDGIGFNTETIALDPSKEDSTGLYNLKNRALALGAELLIESRLGHGTTIIIHLPI